MPAHMIFPKKVALGFLNPSLSTKPRLSAPHLQGLKSNKIHVHFHIVNNESTEIFLLELKLSMKVYNQLGSK